jgi:hypothetical protein
LSAAKFADAVYWPEHPLRGVGPYISLAKLDRWQKNEYDFRMIQTLKDMGGNELMSGEFGIPHVIRKSGYIRYTTGNFPLNFEHRIVYWQGTGYDEKVLGLLKSGKATVHHRNGTKDDNRPENLDLRLKHPHGNNADDWVYILSLTKEGRQKMRDALR